MEDKTLVAKDIVVPELYFLIYKLLSNGPLQQTAKVFAEELQRSNMLPRRIDWTGQEHDQTLEELERKYPHIGQEHLLQIVKRVPQILDLDKDIIPSVTGVLSLLGAGRQSLLRTKESISRPRKLFDYCTRLNHMPLSDVVNRNNTHNLVRVLYGRQSSGPITKRLAIPTSFYSKQSLLRRTLGHLSAVYCVLFDRTGKYIITGADDLLVKLWSATDGRLLATFRGASAEITDIAVNLDNSLLAAGSLDRILRVWDLQTGGPIAVLSFHTGMITSVNFCPSPKSDLRYLVTTSTDGSVAFWEYSFRSGNKTTFNTKPISYHEKLRPGQAQMICGSFSPGGIFLAAGSADHHVRVYLMSEDGPKRVLETEAHSDTVDSIQWAHNGLRFISGSKDGTALVWHFETQQWKSMRLSMSDRLSTCPPKMNDDTTKLKVTMVSWDYSDNWVITAVNDHTIKVWNVQTGKLHGVLRGHTNEIYVLESHPKDSRVLLSAGHDGQLYIWDIVHGCTIASFLNHIDGQGNGGIFDAKWSPDGTMIAATDSHGHILMFGFGSGHERFKILPKELFFHTDYRPLIRDVSHYVLDEQTQQPPHLMPPPFLVDIDGNPYPPAMQKLVPGREDCPSDQLVPNIAIGAEGVEVIEGAVSHIDRLIAALANRQSVNDANERFVDRRQSVNDGNDQAPDSNNDRDNNRANPSPRFLGPRRGYDVRGVRVSMGDWQRDGKFKFHRRTYVQPMNYSNLQNLKQTVYSAGVHEQDIYRREMRRRPMMITTGNTSSLLNNTLPRGRGRRRGRAVTNGVDPTIPRPPPPAYRTRAVRENEPIEDEDMDPDHQESSSSASSNSDDSTAIEDELDLSGSSTTDTDSSDYSDWVAHEPGRNLEPPKRAKRKHVQRRAYSPPESDAAAASNEPVAGPSNGRKPKVRKIPIPRDGEIPEQYRPPEWLSEVIPRKAPYYPQMGDEIAYFRQGHQRYLDAVRSKNVYNLGNKCEPWSQMEIRDHEVCKVIGIKYEIKPPRLCCLKLGILGEEGKLTGQSFAIKYHDMPDVLDFLVLRQTFDTSIRRNWGPGDRFRCMIDDVWWMGQIESHNELSADFPDSLFMCFRVRWDNGEYEFMSPWDLEPVDENRLPPEVGGAVPVLPEELNATLYQPKPEEWPRGDRDASCRRIIIGLEQVMGLAIADLFLAPVDLNLYPEYAFVVEYPIDLSTIKARFENHFYRRITSAQFDVRYLATNAEKFNESHSNIVKHARIITDLCLRILRDLNEIDVPAVYHQLVDTYISSESEGENQAGPSTSTRRPTGSRRSRRLVPEGDWRVDCRELLEMLWQCDDSTPFREPVDTLDHPDYLQIVDTPMDLRTIKEDLLGGNYESPLDFYKDMRLIFLNSRNYNTNKRSRIYSMTLRLGTLFEAHIKPIIYDWKSARRRETKNGENKRATPKKDERPKRRSNGANGGAGPSSRNNNSDDDDDDDDDESGNGRKKNRHRNGVSRRIKPMTSNGVSSSNNVMEPQPGPSRRIGRPPKVRSDAEGETIESSSDSSSPSDSSDDSDDSGNLPLSQTRRGYDSGESYNPRKRPIVKKFRGRKKRKNRKQKSPVTSSTRAKPGRKRKESLSDDYNPGSYVLRKEQKLQTNGTNGPRATRRNDDYNGGNQHHSENDKPKNNKRTRRSTRNNTETSYESDNKDDHDDDDDSDSKPNKRHKRYESDHSYHMDTPNNPRLTSGSEDHEIARPTRSSIRKAQAEWGKSEDSLEEPHDDENDRPSTSNAQPSTRCLRQRKHVSESEQSPEETSNISKRGSTRRANLARNQMSDSDNENLDQPSTSSAYVRARPNRRAPASRLSTFRSRVLRDTTVSSNINGNGSIVRHGRRVANLRSHSSYSETTVATAGSSHSQSQTPPPHTVDHNYGEPGPSSIRQTRNRNIVLSRHQRNANELDHVRRIPAPDDDDSDDDEPLRPRVPSQQISPRILTQQLSPRILRNRNSPPQANTKRRPPPSRVVEDSEDSDDDNTPLHVVASSSRGNLISSRTRNANSRTIDVRVRYRTRNHRPVSSEDDFGGPGPSSMRNTRKLKRPHYNEESDEEGTDARNKMLPSSNSLHTVPYPRHNPNNSNSSRHNNSHHNNTNNTSNNNINNNNNNQNSSNNSNSDNEGTVSISSRGRVRKITAKARGLFRE